MVRFIILGVFVLGVALGWQLHAWLPAPAPSSPASTAVIVPQPPPDLPTLSPPPASPSPVVEPTPQMQVNRLLAVGDYEQAVSLVYESEDDSLLKQYLLNEAKRLSPQQAMRLLRAFVEVYRFEPQAHVQLAQLFADVGDVRHQLNELFTAKSLHVDARQQTRLQGQINLAVNAWTKKLAAENAYVEQIRLYEYLLQQQPENTHYYLDLAQAQTRAGQHDAARRTLESVRHDSSVGGEARRLLARLDAFENEVKGPAVTLARRDNHFLVDAWINDRQSVRLLIDTGASVTAMSADMRQHLGLSEDDLLQRQWTNTANGRAMAELYQVNSLALDDYRVEPLNIAIIDGLSLPDADGLLGMNFLSRFEFNIDQQSGKLYLRPR